MTDIKQKTLLTLMAGSMLLYSCQNEELNTGNADNRMLLSVSAPQSRATVDNTWDAGNKVAVKYGGVVKEYTVGEGNALQTDAPFEWAETEQTIEAWFTGDNSSTGTCPGTFTVKTDQNADDEYAKSDFLHSPAHSITKTENNQVTLDFYHQIAKLVVNIKTEESNAEIGDLTIGDNNIAVTGEYTAPTGDNNYGTWSNQTSSSTITPKALATAAEGYEKSYTALIIPQTVNGTLFKVGELKYTSNKPFESGKQYTYNITITKGGDIEVKLEESGEWNAGEPVQISYLGDTNDPAKVNVGDLILSDGSFIYRANAASMTAEQKTNCRAVIFMAEVQNPNKDNSDYSQTGIGQKTCHGYAVALHQARPYSSNKGVCKWSTTTTPLELNYGDWPIDDWAGYSHTKKVLTHVKNNNITMNAEEFGAVFWTTIDYQTKYQAPKNTSGWFLPSSGQMKEVIDKCNNGLFSNLPDGLVENLLGPYWTSTEDKTDKTQIATIAVHYDNNKRFIAARKFLQSDNGQIDLKVRSILAY